GKIISEISSSSLSRLMASHGVTREQRLVESMQEMNLKFEFFFPLECVQADCLHGPVIPGPGGKPVKAILIAFIDDATRRIVYAEFTVSEHSLAFEKGIRHILASQGRIGRLYVDNGSTFVSQQTSRILDTLQIHLVHSTPHRPQGRGKIERFFRTVRDGFLRVLDVGTIKSFDELNLKFRIWLESDYHRNPHKGLQDHQSPLEAWSAKASHLKALDPSLDMGRVFYHECYRRVAKDQTVTIDGVLFEVPSLLIGKKICLRYDPHKPRLSVEAVSEGKSFGDCRQVDAYANTRVRRSLSTKGAIEDQTKATDGSVQAGLAAATLTGGKS
ncbi:MAG: DDE-type integrase/transposase/recombinase, partial [Rectinemataceae bacterium]|nr:DDE-type integrase/transposase/recombinase [Rectinemataceae bacterium]